MGYTSRALVPIINELNKTYRVNLTENDVVLVKAINPHNLHDFIDIEVEISLNGVKTNKTFKLTRLDIREVLKRHKLPNTPLSMTELFNLIQTPEYPIYNNDVVLNYNLQENRLHVIAQSDSLYYYNNTVLDQGLSEIESYQGKAIHGIMVNITEDKPLDFHDIFWSRLDGTVESSRSVSAIPGYNHVIHPRIKITEHIKVRKDRYWLRGEFRPMASDVSLFTTLIYDPYEGVVHDMFDTISPNDTILNRDDDIYWIIKKNKCLAINELGHTKQEYEIPYDVYGAVKEANNYFVLLIKDGDDYILRTWHPNTGPILSRDIQLKASFSEGLPFNFIRHPVTNYYLIQFPVDKTGDWYINNNLIPSTGIKTGWISIKPTGLIDSNYSLTSNIPYYIPYTKNDEKPKYWIVNNDVITTYKHQDAVVTRVNTMTVDGVPLFQNNTNLSSLVGLTNQHSAIYDVWYDQGWYVTAHSNQGTVLQEATSCDQTQVLSTNQYYVMRINPEHLPPKHTTPLLEQGGKLLLYGWGTSYTPLLIS